MISSHFLLKKHLYDLNMVIKLLNRMLAYHRLIVQIWRNLLNKAELCQRPLLVQGKLGLRLEGNN